MNTAVINLRVDSLVKSQAQNVAEELGFSLSSLINAFLKQITRTGSVSFAIPEEPSEYLLASLAESEKDIKAGKISPAFTSTDSALKWLESKGKRYVKS